MLERKPPHGAPCNSCGLCCHAVLCPLGAAVFGNQRGPCPALRFNDKAESTCALTATPEPQRSAALYLIGAGDGCDARFNGEPRNIAFAEALDARKASETDRLHEAEAAWGVSGLEW